MQPARTVSVRAGLPLAFLKVLQRECAGPRTCGFLHVLRYGAARSAISISVTAVRANQLPRAVTRADALPWRMLSISMPSRPRSATVTPETGLSWVLADDALQAPSRL